MGASLLEASASAEHHHTVTIWKRRGAAWCVFHTGPLRIESVVSTRLQNSYALWSRGYVTRNKGVDVMTPCDRLKIKAVAGAGLCGAALALSPDAAAVPLITGGYACVQGIAGETAPTAAAGGPVVAEICSPPAPAGAALSGAGGAAPVAPGPVAAPAPVGAPAPRRASGCASAGWCSGSGRCATACGCGCSGGRSGARGCSGTGRRFTHRAGWWRWG